MKRFLSILFFQAALSAQTLTIGGGAYFQTQPYTGASALVVPSPVIFYDNGIVYARWTRFGVYFYGKKTPDLAWGFSLTAQPRPNGYSPKDSSALQGLEERKTSFEGGIAFSITQNDVYLETMLLSDLLGRYDSYIAKTEVGFTYKTANLSWYPSIVVIYESKAFVNYYYGITQEEASRTPYAYYKPNGGVRVALQTYASYPISKRFSLFFNARIDRLTQGAIDSPIVEDTYVYSGLASLIYTFAY